ncbi:MAG: phosphatase PAP2 family protein [Anaerolineaceae bacterium]
MMLQAIRDFDHHLTEKICIHPEQKLLWYCMSFLAHTGDSWFWLAGLFLVWMFSKGEWHNRAAMIAVGIAIEIIIIFILKFTIRRSRPEGEWGAIYRLTDPHSFPSGHAARAGLLAAMAIGVGPAWFMIILLIWAPLMSLARVSMGVHFFMDILAGLFIGALIGGLVFALAPFWVPAVPFLFR